MKGILGRLTYANVVATLALFIALGGASYAAIKLPKNSVGTKQLKPNAVTGAKIANGSITAKDFAVGVAGPNGSPGPSGARGLDGAPGPAGSSGLDGAAVAVRARSAGSVETPADGSQVTVPLTGNEWTQAADELDLGPFGSFTFTAPGPSSCGGSGLALILWSIEVDGAEFESGNLPTVRDGGTRSASIPSERTLWRLLEPGTATHRTATIKFHSLCESGSTHPAVGISDVRFDLVRAS